MVNHILIVGPGRSGSTLLVKLMRAFGNTRILDDTADSEISILSFSPADKVHPHMDLIRGNEFITVTKYPREAFRLDLVYKAIHPARLGVIFVTRDYRDVLVSKRGGYSEDVYWVDWPRCKAFESVLHNYRGKPEVLEVSYKNLVTEPDRTQDLVAKTFDLRIERTFTDYWNQMIEETSFHSQTEAALRGLRPISADSISNWRKAENKARLVKCLDNYPEIPFCLFDWKYTRDFDWVRDIRG